MNLINQKSRHQTIRGPLGLVLHLDADEIFPNDPGMGTPRLFELRGETMTFDCAMDNASELGCSDGQIAWIHSLYDAGNDWLDHQYEANRT